jgi:hypothetical protein
MFPPPNSWRHELQHLESPGLYRVFYIGQSFVTCGMLVTYIRQQQSKEIYRIEGPLAVLMHTI